MKNAENLIRELAAVADVEINGSRYWDMQVNDPRSCSRMLRDGPFALGESYMDGWWDTLSLDDLIFRLIRADLERRISPLKLVFPVLRAKLFNLQHRGRAYRIGERHREDGGNGMDLSVAYLVFLAHSCSLSGQLSCVLVLFP